MNMIFNFIKSTDARILILCLAAMLMLSLNSNAQSDCTMVCKGPLNVTLDPQTCTAELVPADLTNATCPGDYTIEILEGNGVVANGTNSVTVDRPGNFIYRVTNSDGIPCWGNLAVEDKSGPVKKEDRTIGDGLDLDPETEVCGELMADPSRYDDLATQIVSCVVEESGYSLEPWFDILEENDFIDCSGILEVRNFTTIINYCDEPNFEIDATIPTNWEAHQIHKRGWFAIDIDGNYSDTCYQNVITIRPTNIKLDKKVEVDCSDAADIMTGPSFRDVKNGTELLTCPETSNKRVTMSEGLYCGYLVSVHCDEKIAICGEAYKDNVYKQSCHWTIADWCTGNKKYDEFTQVVEVKDDTAPVVTEGTVNLQSGPFACEADLIVGPASFDEEEECTTVLSWETIIEYGDISYEGGFFERVSVPTNGISLSDIPSAAEVMITWKATDACGNVGEEKVTLSPRDQSAPVCIANDEIIVGLITDDPVEHTLAARVYAEDIDDSSYDNCQEIELLVRRHDQKLIYLTEGKDIEELWAPYVEFSDKDLADGACEATLKVELLVREKRNNGLSTECFGHVTIENKTAPIASAPDDIYVDCDGHVPGFGQVELWGACNKDYEVKTDTLVNDRCAYDVIFHARRTWTPFSIVDGAKNFGKPVSQSIKVTNVHDIKMEFPIDMEVDCNADGTIPAPLDIEDILSDNGCGQWKMNVSDKYYTSAEEADCQKVIREYEFINWCTWKYDRSEVAVVNRPDELILDEAAKVFLIYQDADRDGINDIDDADDADMDIYNQYDGMGMASATDGSFVLIDNFDMHDDLANYPGTDGINGRQVNYVDGYHYGRFVYRQIIKITDNTAPELTGGIDDVTCDPLAPSCTLVGDVTASFTTTDNCSDVALSYELLVDGSDVAVQDTFGSLVDGTITGRYPTGTHAFIVTARDGCNNVTAKSYEFTVGPECKKPTPICLATFTALMENGMVEIWASDVESGSSYDNCTEYKDLEFAIQRVQDVNGDGNYTSADISDVMPTESVVTLNCGDIPNGKVVVALWARDEAGNTQFCLTPIYVTDNDEDCDGVVADVQAKISGAITNEGDEEIDDVMVKLDGNGISSSASMFNGIFSFDVPMNRDVTVAPEKEGNYLNGVTTADLVALQRHILGMNPINSAYKIIAADATNDTKVDTRDMLHVSRLILGIYEEFPNNASWRFVSKDQVFTNPTSPWGFEEVINLSNLSQDAQADFIGIKVGDVTGNARVSNLLGDEIATQTLELAMEDSAINEGEVSEIVIKAGDFKNIAGLQFTMNVDAEILEVIPGDLPNLTGANFGEQKIDEGVLTLAWANVESINLDNNDALFTLKIRSNRTTNVSDLVQINSSVTEATAYDNDLNAFNVRMNFLNSNNAGFVLFQNTPNPFRGNTTIAFDLAKADHITLKVMDISGKTVQFVEGDYTKGSHSIDVASAAIKATGVMYYELTTSAGSATKKMIILE